MESSWNFDGENIDWNMEKPWTIGTLENRRLENTETC